MYASIKLKYLDNNRNKMIKESIESGDSTKGIAMAPDLKDEIESYEFDDGEIHICLTNELGYFSIDYTMTDEEMMNIVRHMKTKGERIRELIKLAEAP